MIIYVWIETTQIDCQRRELDIRDIAYLVHKPTDKHLIDCIDRRKQVPIGFAMWDSIFWRMGQAKTIALSVRVCRVYMIYVFFVRIFFTVASWKSYSRKCFRMGARTVLSIFWPSACRMLNSWRLTELISNHWTRNACFAISVQMVDSRLHRLARSVSTKHIDGVSLWSKEKHPKKIK